MKEYSQREIWKDKAALEARLDELLQPVAPRPDFVRGLRVRLMKGEAPPALETNLPRNLVYALLGVISSVLIVITGVKATRSLRGRHNMRTQVQQEPAAPLNPAV